MKKKQYTIIANWKMNLTLKESVFLIKKYKQLKKRKSLEVVVAPAYPALFSVKKILKNSGLKLAAQNAAGEISGALSGEVSPAMLKEVGCTYVILGHSERKKYFNETLEMISKKVAVALGEGLIPIICVGETAEERTEGLAETVIESRVKESLAEVEDLSGKQIIISYEPFWTISSSHGRIATDQEVNDACQVIRQALIDLYGLESVQESVKIIYGGTVNAETISDFLNLDIIEGFLVGSASLKIDSFKELLQSF